MIKKSFVSMQLFNHNYLQTQTHGDKVLVILIRFLCLSQMQRHW